MKAVGLVFLYDRNLGEPEVVSKDFSEFFSGVSENLVKEGLMALHDLKRIIDNQLIFWGGIKENFEQITEDDEAIGKLAWQVFTSNSKVGISEEVRSLVYDGSKAPWEFTLMACVVYK